MDGFSLDAPSHELGIEPNFTTAISLGDDTGTGDSGASDGPRRRKPRSDAGQPRGSRGGTGSRKRVKSQVSVDSLARSIAFMTATAARMSKIPEIEFDKEDSQAEAEAIGNLLKEFEIEIDPKLDALIALIGTTLTIAGAKIYLYKDRVKAENARNVTQ